MSDEKTSRRITKTPGPSTPLKNSGHGHAHKGGHGHAHGHAHGHGSGASGNLQFAFFLNFGFSLVELAGGFWIGSFAIMAGAIHDFGDSISLGVAWFLERVANRKRDERFNFGYRRFSLLSALIAGIVIAAGNAIIVFECLRRFLDQNLQSPRGGSMIALSLVGLLVNSVAAWRMSLGQSQNERILTWHLIEDILGWALVLVGGIAIHFTHLVWLDPLLATALAIFVSFNVFRHLRTTVFLFLQGRPDNFDEDEFLKQTLSIEGIGHVDHLAVWSLDGERNVLSARLHLHTVRDPEVIEQLKAKVRGLAKEQQADATLETCLHEEKAHDDG